MKTTLKMEIDDEKGECLNDLNVFLKGPKLLSSLLRITNLIRSQLDRETFPVTYQKLLERILDEAQEYLNEVD